MDRLDDIEGSSSLTAAAHRAPSPDIEPGGLDTAVTCQRCGHKASSTTLTRATYYGRPQPGAIYRKSVSERAPIRTSRNFAALKGLDRPGAEGTSALDDPH